MATNKSTETETNTEYKIPMKYIKAGEWYVGKVNMGELCTQGKSLDDLKRHMKVMIMSLAKFNELSLGNDFNAEQITHDDFVK